MEVGSYSCKIIKVDFTRSHSGTMFLVIGFEPSANSQMSVENYEKIRAIEFS